jgi:hypothetical protein
MRARILCTTRRLVVAVTLVFVPLLIAPFSPARAGPIIQNGVEVGFSPEAAGIQDFAYYNQRLSLFEVTFSSGFRGGRPAYVPISTDHYRDVPVPGDWNHDGRTDFVLWWPSDGSWHVKYSYTGGFLLDETVLPSIVGPSRGDYPVPADYDGDGYIDVAIWRSLDGTWYGRYSSTGGFFARQWGALGDLPVPADYDGDGKIDLGVYRQSTATWWVVDSSTGRQWNQQWGAVGDKPVPGHYWRTCSGAAVSPRADLAVFRPSSSPNIPGLAQWWVFNTATGVGHVCSFVGAVTSTPVPADYDGDGTTDFADYDGHTWTAYLSTGGMKRDHSLMGEGEGPVPGGNYDGDTGSSFARRM